MDIFEAIAKRHSYRGEFYPEPVPREALRQIVQAGIQAPSGCNGQSTSFVIVDDPAQLARLQALVPSTAPAMIACVVDTQLFFGSKCFEIEDCCAAVENMLLAVTALGYASLWLDGPLRGGVDAQISGFLGIPPGQRIELLLPVGIPKTTVAQREKKPFAERAWFNTYGG